MSVEVTEKGWRVRCEFCFKRMLNEAGEIVYAPTRKQLDSVSREAGWRRFEGREPYFRSACPDCTVRLNDLIRQRAAARAAREAARTAKGVAENV